MKPKHGLFALLALMTAVEAQRHAAEAQAGDSILTGTLQVCDQRAAEEAAAATGRKGIAPIDLLAWPLLLNDLAQRRQQEADEPRLLAEVEQRHQQCRLAAQGAAAQRAEEARKQASEAKQGYERLSVQTFVLDGNQLAANGAKVSLSGAYLGSDNISFLFVDNTAVILATKYPNLGDQPKVPLLLDGATRELRKRALLCRSNPGSAQVGCQMTVIGRAKTCSLQNALGVTTHVPCLSVEDGR